MTAALVAATGSAQLVQLYVNIVDWKNEMKRKSGE